MSLDGLAADWDIPEKGVLSLLSTFEIPLIKLPGGDKQYVSLWSLEIALFEAGLPAAAKGSQEAVRTIHESAGIVYGTLSREVIRERVMALARSLRTVGPRSHHKKREELPTRSRKH